MNYEEIEKKAQEYAQRLVNEYDQDLPELSLCDLKFDCQNAFIAGAQMALQNQWISVKERLPEENEEVLLYDANSVRHYVTGWRRMKGDNKSQWALSNGFVEDKDITNWLPIPQLNPEKEER